MASLTCHKLPSRAVFVLLGIFSLFSDNVHGLRLSSFSRQQKIYVSGCPKTPVSNCDFYFEGYSNQPLVIRLDGAPDTPVGPYLIDSRTGKKVQVGNTGVGSVVCNGGSKLSSAGNQFHFAGQDARTHIRAFNQPPKADLENLCIVLPLLAIQTNGLNLNPGDNNQKLYPDSRRCVLLSTGPSGSCSSSPSPSSPPPLTPSSPPPTKPYFPSLFAFGDSTLDIGNNNVLKSPVHKVNIPPYGIDYILASGRYSSGKGFMDYFGDLCGLTPVNKFVDLNSTNSDEFATGINFASGGSAAYISATCMQDTTCTDFPTQILQFKNLSTDVYSKENIAKSLFVISIGNNDYFAYAQNPSAYNITEFVTSVVTAISAGIQALYQEGARKFLVVGIGEFDCTPLAFAALNTSTVNTVCSPAINLLVKTYNGALQGALATLSSATAFFPGIEFVFGDSAKFINRVRANPSKYGYTNVTSACCGGGAFNVLLHCGAPGNTVCTNRDEYVWWDPIHLTQKGWGLIAEGFFNGNPNYVWPYGAKVLSTL